MNEDFLRLVSQANPAARQYHPANNAFPPLDTPYQDNTPQLLDPFFDDDDDNVPDSAFGSSHPMRSQESGLPLATSAAPPAGTSQTTLGNGPGQGWNFADGELQNTTFNGFASFPSQEKPRSPKRKAKRRWKWPWVKEKQLAGERIITLNNSAANADFGSNSISTSKYNLATFVPKFLFGESSCLTRHRSSNEQSTRAILKIRQSVLLVYCVHPANTGCVAN